MRGLVYPRLESSFNTSILYFHMSICPFCILYGKYTLFISKSQLIKVFPKTLIIVLTYTNNSAIIISANEARKRGEIKWLNTI